MEVAVVLRRAFLTVSSVKTATIFDPRPSCGVFVGAFEMQPRHSALAWQSG